MDDTAPGVIPDLEPFLPEFPPPLFTGAAASSGAGLQTTATPNFDLSRLTKVLEQQVASHLQLQQFVQQLALAQMSNAPAAAAPPPSAPVPPPQPAKKELRFTISGTLSAKLTSEGARIRKELHRVALGKAHLVKINEQLEALSSGTIQPQLKPFKLGFEAEEWQSKVGEYDLSNLIVPAKGHDSLEDVAERLHMEHLASTCLLH